MQSAVRRLVRPAIPVLVGVMTLTGVGLGVTASPAVADANLNVALTVTAPVTGAAANTLYVGEQANYALTVSAGPTALTGVAFTDTLPADVTYNSVSGGGWSCVLAGPALTCKQANTVAANTTSTATVNLTLSASTVLSSVTFTPVGTAATPSGATGTTSVTAPVVADADLTVAQVMQYTPDPPAGDVAWTYTVTNNGGSAETGTITVIDTLPAGYTLDTFASTGTDVWNCSQPAAVLTCTDPNASNLAAGASSGVTVNEKKAAAAGRLTTEAHVTGSLFDPNPANNYGPAPQSAIPDGSVGDFGPCGAPSAAVPPVRTCNLVALAGSLAPIAAVNGGKPIDIWGFGMDTGPATSVASLPGPTLVAVQGETLDLNVRNALPIYDPGAKGTCSGGSPPAQGPPDCNWLSVVIPGIQTSHPSEDGVPSNGTLANVYKDGTAVDSNVYKNLAPGTYLYEASPSVNGARQVAMGLSGLLVVRPTGFQTGTPTQTLFTSPTVQSAALPAAGPTTTTTTAPVSTTTTGAPGPTTTAGPSPTTTAAPAPTTTAAPSPTTTAAPAPTTTVATAAAAAVGPTTTAASAPTTTAAPAPTTTAAPAPTTTAAPAPTTTAAPAPTTTSSTTPGTTTTTTAPGGPQAGAALNSAPLAAPPANACTSPGTSSAFTAEAVVQLFELSSEFHSMPFTSTFVPGGGNGPVNSEQVNNPGGSADRAVYAPDVFLINGLAYPNTETTVVGPGDCVALHFADMGLREKSLGVLGRREILMSEDSYGLSAPEDVANHYTNPGEEFDAVVDMNGSSLGANFPIMDFEHHLSNGAGTATNTATPKSNTGMTLGGMMAILQVAGATPASANPVIDKEELTQNTIAFGGGAPMPPATIGLASETTPTPVACGEWTIDAVDTALTQGSACPGGSHAVDASGAGTVPTSELTGLSNGDHIIWERVRDSAGDWSDPSGAVLTVDTVAGGTGGPTLSNLNVDPTVTNGYTYTKTVGAGAPCTTNTPDVLLPDPTVVPSESCDLIIDGTATPSLADWQITGFNWSVGGQNGNVPGGGSPGSPVEITAPIPQSVIDGLVAAHKNDKAADPLCPPGSPLGTMAIQVSATETEPAITGSLRTGNPVPICFVLTANGPTVEADLALQPNPAGPSSDTDGNLNYTPSVHVTGTLTDTQDGIARGEMYYLPEDGSGHIKPPASGPSPIASGQGVVLTATRGQWDVPPRNDAATVTSGSSKVFDPSVRMSDEGRSVSGPGISAGTIVDNVVVKGKDTSTYQFTLEHNGAPETATSTGTAVEIGASIGFYTDLPSTEFNGMPQGFVTVYVHGQDEAGNWGQWRAATLKLDKTEPVILDTHTPVVPVGAAPGDCLTACPGPQTTANSPRVTVSGPPNNLKYLLHFRAVDPDTLPPACIPATLTFCGERSNSTVAAIEWTISYVDSVDITEQNDFTQFLATTPGITVTPTPPPGQNGNGPENVTVDISAGPQPYTAPATVVYRIMDGAGNWTNWYTTNIP